MLHSPRTSFGRTVIVLAVVALLAGCATTGKARDPRDPWEGLNRSTYKFNSFMDRNLFNPMGRAYKKITPKPVDTGISNFFSNLKDISVVANDVLQLKGQFASDAARFVFNSSFGLFGLIDVSSHIGLPRHKEDFGQTLGVWGVGPGPYLIVPLFGPSTVRDATGLLVDGALFSPISLSYLHNDAYRGGLMGLKFIKFKADLLSTRNLIKEASVDPYEFTKNAYLNRRDNMVHDKSTAQPSFKEIMNE